MRITLPRQLFLALVASFTVSIASTTLHAQTSADPITPWSQAEIETFKEDMSTQPPVNVTGWDDIVELLGTPATSSDAIENDKVYAIAAGTTVINPDGTTTTMAETVYITRGGAVCDSTGTRLRTDSNDLIPFTSRVVMSESLSSQLNTALQATDPTIENIYTPGIFILGSYVDDGGGHTRDLYETYGNGTGGNDIYIQTTGAKSDTNPGDVINSETQIVGGTVGTSYGTVEAPVSNNIYINLNGITPQLYSVAGGNAIAYYLDEPASVNANFVGDTHIVAGFSEPSTREPYQNNLDYVIGGNNAKVNSAAEGATPQKHEANFTGNTHIALEFGAHTQRVVGGNMVDENYYYSHVNTDVNANFTGTTYIVVDNGAYAEHIVGGNYGNSTESNFVGTATEGADVRIDVLFGPDSPINGLESTSGVTGANLITRAIDNSFTGDVDINIYSHDFIENYKTSIFRTNGIHYADGIKGGFSSLSNTLEYDNASLEGATATLKGNTDVTVDFSDNSVATEFNASIVGGSFATHGLNVTHEGGATLNITGMSNGDTDVFFSNYIVGGNVNADSNVYNSNGDESLIHRSLEQSHTTIDKVTVNVDSGTYRIRHGVITDRNVQGIFTVGSMTLGGGSITTGSAEANISGGTFNHLIGGNTSITQEGALDLQVLDENEAFKDRSVGTSHVGEINLNISGGTYYKVTAGSYIGDDVEQVIKSVEISPGVFQLDVNHNALTTGDISLNITGGSLGYIVGGSSIGSVISHATPTADGSTSAEAYSVTQGNINISIKGDALVGSNVFAAGEYHAYTEPDKESVGIYYVDGDAEKGVLGVIDAATAIRNKVLASGADGSIDITDWESRNFFEEIVKYEVPDTSSSITSALNFTTESTTVELGKDVEFEAFTTISGDYARSLTEASGTTDEYLSEGVYSVQEEFDYYLPKTRSDLVNDLADVPAEEREAFLAAYDEWVNQWELNYNNSLYEASMAAAGASANATVTKDRSLVLNDGVYENLDTVSFIEFDEIHVDTGSSADFAQNKQDLDLFAGRNVLEDGATRVTVNSEGTRLMSGTNTVRKTGDGILALGVTNGQVGSEDNLQLVVEGGTVALAADSAAVNQSNFKTIAVQSGAGLDMQAGSNILGSAAGINGHLNLEQAAILIADATRSARGSGTSMFDGRLTVNKKFMLELTNVEGMASFSNETFLLEGGGTLELGAFRVVLFSNLDFDIENITGIDFFDGTWLEEDAKIALASDYMYSNISLGNGDVTWDNEDTYIVWQANGDFMLTSGSAINGIPEPSTATLSILALAGLLARRRRKKH